MATLLKIVNYPLIVLICQLCTFSNVNANDYHVGPAQKLKELDQVPWLRLSAGDTVNIHYRVEPYRTKIGLKGQGSPDKPIVIRGIKGPKGELPVISGKNAKTPKSLANAGFFNERYDENLALILIKRGPDDNYKYDKPKYIIIENLKLTGAYEKYTFENSNGGVVHYASGAAPIWAVLVDNLIVRNCELTDSGNGLFVLSKSGGKQQVSHNILIENNYIYGNGTTGHRYDRHHNVYTQASGITFQFNHLGRLRSGAGGSVIKDRSSGTVIRYNWIETAARVLDLVDPEESYDYLVPNQSKLDRKLSDREHDRLNMFRNTYVYGNIFFNDLTDNSTISSSNMIHYGGDTGVEEIYRKGTLHFYNNTVYIKSDQRKAYFMRIFDVSTNEETVSLKNNIIYQDGDSLLRMGNRLGIIRFDATNFINKNWGDFKRKGPGAKVLIAEGVSLIESNNHCFVNKDSLNLKIVPESKCIDMGTMNLGKVILEREYVDPFNSKKRIITGKSIDLGAYESIN